MKNKIKKEKISRRNILPLLGSALLIPFLGAASPMNNSNLSEEDGDETYQTLLKPDGTTVKVKNSVLKNAEVVKKNISNKSLLNWLGKKK